MSRDLSNHDDVIDSRDVIARIEELQEERDALAEVVTEAEAAARSDLDASAGEGDEAELGQAVADARRDLAAWSWSKECAELKSLLSLQSEAEGYSEDWQHGSTLVRDSYFVDYARELCEDIGSLPEDLPHYIEIDWEATARNIRQDYTSVDFDGVTYWVR